VIYIIILWWVGFRVVSSSLKCFHELMKKIRDRCGADGADEYYRSYIQPLVDQSRDIVTSYCTLAPPYDQDFKSSASSMTSHRKGRITSSLAVLSTLVSLRETVSAFTRFAIFRNLRRVFAVLGI